MANSVQVDSFLATNPRLVCTVSNVAFYEHPDHVGDSILLYIDKGILKFSGFYNAPTVEQVSDLLRDN